MRSSPSSRRRRRRPLSGAPRATTLPSLSTPAPPARWPAEHTMGEVTAAEVSRLVPFVVALRRLGRVTGCQPVGQRVPTALPGRRGPEDPPCLELPPETPLPLSRDFYRSTGYPVGNSGHTPGHQLNAVTCASARRQSDLLSETRRIYSRCPLDRGLLCVRQVR